MRSVKLYVSVVMVMELEREDDFLLLVLWEIKFIVFK